MKIYMVFMAFAVFLCVSIAYLNNPVTELFLVRG